MSSRAQLKFQSVLSRQLTGTFSLPFRSQVSSIRLPSLVHFSPFPSLFLAHCPWLSCPLPYHLATLGCQSVHGVAYLSVSTIHLFPFSSFPSRSSLCSNHNHSHLLSPFHTSAFFPLALDPPDALSSLLSLLTLICPDRFPPASCRRPSLMRNGRLQPGAKQRTHGGHRQMPTRAGFARATCAQRSKMYALGRR